MVNADGDSADMFDLNFFNQIQKSNISHTYVMGTVQGMRGILCPYRYGNDNNFRWQFMALYWLYGAPSNCNGQLKLSCVQCAGIRTL